MAGSEDSQGNDLFVGREVWVPFPITGYTLATIEEFKEEVKEEKKAGKVIKSEKIKLIVAKTKDKGEVISVPHQKVHILEKDLTKDVDDNCGLMHLNEGNLLNNLKLRYDKDNIYTYVANILIAVNPFREIPGLCDISVVHQYKGKSLGMMPPHIYAISDKAHREMKSSKQSQSIIVSGESGAGKSEATKLLLKYLVTNWGANSGPIEQRIIECSPLLEAFGNAKTSRNNNSSRFGKFVEIHFDDTYEVCGGKISHYLLEKSRVCTQNSDERDYHIFYFMLMGAEAALKDKLQLKGIDDYDFLKNGSKAGLSQEKMEHEFREMDSSMTHMQITQEDKDSMYTILAGILHLGNVKFINNVGKPVCPESRPILELGAKFMGINPDDLNTALSTKVSGVVTKGLGEVEARKSRDALAKFVYSKMFDYIVLRINQAIPFSSSKAYIGVLDIAGFEFFRVNSYEQFCINYCNEILQGYFNEKVLSEEQELYAKEGLVVKKIEFADNANILALLTGTTAPKKTLGIFGMLDEALKTNQAPRVFCKSVLDEYGYGSGPKKDKNPRLDLARNSTDPEQKKQKIGADEGFLVRHFAGDVVYQTEQFVDKNDNSLHNSLKALVLNSSVPLMRELFKGEVIDDGKGGGKGKRKLVTVGSLFRDQLKELMEKLQSTGSSFVRCVKPNSLLKPQMFQGELILNQLNCSGMTCVLDLMQEGFPSRTQFSDLYDMYQHSMPSTLQALDARTFCKSLFQALGLNENDFKFGMTKVFFRPGKFAEFDQIMRADEASLKDMIKKVQNWLLGSRWRKAIYTTLSTIKLMNNIKFRAQSHIHVQNAIRSALKRQIILPRIKGMEQMDSIYKKIDSDTSGLIAELTTNKDNAMAKVNALKEQVMANMDKIKTLNEPSEMTALCQTMDGEKSNLVKAIKAYLDEEAAERKRKEEEERKKREEEERKKREEEAARKKAEEEAKKAEEERKRKEEEEKRAAMSEQQQKEDDERRRKQEEERQKQEAAAAAKAAEAAAAAKAAEAAAAAAKAPEAAAAAAQEAESADVDDEVAVAQSLSSISAAASGPHSVPVSVVASASEKSYTDDRGSTPVSIPAVEEKTTPVIAPAPVAAAAAAGPSTAGVASTTAGPVAGDSNPYLEVSDVGPGPVVRGFAPPPIPTITAPAASGASGGMWQVPEDNEFANALHMAPTPRDIAKYTVAQTFFLVPFIHRKDASRYYDPMGDGREKGYWLSHFDGDRVARQLELHPGRMPMLLVAGSPAILDQAECSHQKFTLNHHLRALAHLRLFTVIYNGENILLKVSTLDNFVLYADKFYSVNDENMCQLTLQQTGLLKMPRAEISRATFEQFWMKFKGQDFLLKNKHRISSPFLRLGLGVL